MTRRIATFVTLLASTTFLAACSGSNTYGTGVSQEAQLLSDLSGIVALGPAERKKPIDYSARPKLVRAPADGTLPSPAEQGGGAESAYFPTNPEERQAARNARVAKPWTRRDGGIDHTIPEDVDAPSASREAPYEPWRGRADDGTGDREPSAAEMARNSIEGKKERLKRFREITGNGSLGTGPRRYLTQPPQEYRTPAETAAVGDVGEYEYGEKEKKPIFGGLFGNKKEEKRVRPTKSSPADEKAS